MRADFLHNDFHEVFKVVVADVLLSLFKRKRIHRIKARCACNQAYRRIPLSLRNRRLTDRLAETDPDTAAVQRAEYALGNGSQATVHP